MVLFMSATLQIKAQIETTSFTSTKSTSYITDSIWKSPPLIHWSLAVKSGFNYMRTSPDDAIVKDMFHFAYGGNVDYLFSPFLGMGLDVTYNSYSRPSTLGYLDAATLDAIVFGSINISNLLDPYRVGFFKRTNVYATLGPGINQFHFILNGAPEVRHTSFLAVCTLSPEYHLNKTIAFLLEGQYRYYDRTNMGGPSARKGYSDALTVHLGIRFKLGALKNGKTHLRNMDMMNWTPKFRTIIVQAPDAKDWNPEMDAMSKRIKELEKEKADQKMESENDVAPRYSVNTIKQVFFAFGSSNLTAVTCSLLDKFIVELNNSEWSELNVIGNTDSLGEEEFNMKLSFARALSVKNYLVNHGMDASRIFLTGNGEYNPVDFEKTPAARSKNRRVNIVVLK